MIIDNDYDRCREFMKQHGGMSHVDEVCIGYEKDGEIIGAASYGWYTGSTMHMHIAKLKGRFVPMEFIWFAIYYPFFQCGVKMLICMIDSNNRANQVAEHAGFIMTNTIKDGGIEGDLNTWVLTRDSAKLLNYTPRYHHGRQ